MRTARLSTYVLVLVLSGCGGGGWTPPPECDRYVVPGSDDRTAVQTMFEQAEDGETLCFGPGTYRFTDGVSIADLEGVTLLGAGETRGDVVLDFFGMGSGNSGINAQRMTRLVVENLTILDAAQNNLFVTSSTDVTIRDVSSGWVRRPPEEAGKYAIYPVQSSRVVIERCEAFGSSDAGLYVGQTSECIVRDNVAHGNVAGIEIENSTRCEVHGNEAYDNSAGILVFELPGLERQGRSTLVRDNRVRDNDRENFARDGIVRLVPPGIGVMVLAANEVEVRSNEITGNDSAGIVVVSYRTAEELGAPTPADAAYDGFIDDVWLHDNRFENNGRSPFPPIVLIPQQAMPPQSFLEDILYDTFVREPGSVELCVDETGTFRAARTEPGGLFPMQSTDRSPYMCDGMAVPSVTW